MLASSASFAVKGPSADEHWTNGWSSKSCEERAASRGKKQTARKVRRRGQGPSARAAADLRTKALRRQAFPILGSLNSIRPIDQRRKRALPGERERRRGRTAEVCLHSSPALRPPRNILSTLVSSNLVARTVVLVPVRPEHRQLGARSSLGHSEGETHCSLRLPVKRHETFWMTLFLLFVAYPRSLLKAL